MGRSLRVLLPLLVAVVASGCWIFLEPDDECGFWSDECGGWNDDWADDGGAWGGGGGTSGVAGTLCVPGSVRYCDTPTYCSWGEQRCNDGGDGWSDCDESSPPAGCSGFAFDQDCCLDSGSCCQDWLDLDGDGDWNDSVGNCEEVLTCAADAECAGGYCLIDGEGTGVCRPSMPCSGDEDCAPMGAGFACDERGLCAPESSPCPSGECGCAADDECEDGLLCIASRCTRPQSVCFFDFECGGDALCLDNECHARCSVDCPAGQSCEAGICMDPTGGLDECVYDEDCGDAGQVCVNATCLTACADDGACAEREVCRAGACRPDAAPMHECSSDGQCADDHRCVRGFCRLPCAACINCSGEMSVCGADGFCMSPVEVAPECTRAAECAEGESCVSNVCM